MELIIQNGVVLYFCSRFFHVVFNIEDRLISGKTVKQRGLYAAVLTARFLEWDNLVVFIGLVPFIISLNLFFRNGPNSNPLCSNHSLRWRIF